LGRIGGRAIAANCLPPSRTALLTIPTTFVTVATPYEDGSLGPGQAPFG
jgi:hypothetical protein